MQEIKKHESAMSTAEITLKSVKTAADLARALNHVPQVPAFLKCLSDVRSADQGYWRSAEQKADSVFTAQLSHIKMLAGTEKFCTESANFQRSIRQVHSSVPRAAHAALKQLDKIRHDASSSQPVEEIKNHYLRG